MARGWVQFFLVLFFHESIGDDIRYLASQPSRTLRAKKEELFKRGLGPSNLSLSRSQSSLVLRTRRWSTVLFFVVLHRPEHNPHGTRVSKSPWKPLTNCAEWWTKSRGSHRATQYFLVVEKTRSLLVVFSAVVLPFHTKPYDHCSLYQMLSDMNE